ncbi:MAG: cytochrome-c peroxidase, partial [Sphingobacteriales bacterium]
MHKKYLLTFLITTAATLFVTSNFFCKPKKVPANKVELGEQLFFDPILSRDQTISCSSCHLPAFAFADTARVSKGVSGRTGVRNTPSAMNLSLQVSFFWDGRSATLEEQALVPIANPDEMDLPVDTAVMRLREHPEYRRLFDRIFHEPPSPKNLGAALAAFQRSMETSNTAFDDWKVNDNIGAVNESVKRGFKLFNGKANCIQCHFGTDFNNVEFRNIGLFDGIMLNDSGRAAISHNISDLGKFKIGPLRNIALTAPYMHDG